MQEPQFLPGRLAANGRKSTPRSMASGGDAARGGWIGLVPDQSVVGIGFMQVVEQLGPHHPIQVEIHR